MYRFACLTLAFVASSSPMLTAKGRADAGLSLGSPNGGVQKALGPIDAQLAQPGKALVSEDRGGERIDALLANCIPAQVESLQLRQIAGHLQQ